MTANPNPNPNPRPSRWRAATRRLSPRTVRTRVTLDAAKILGPEVKQTPAMNAGEL